MSKPSNTTDRNLRQAYNLADEIKRYRFCAPDSDPIEQHAVTLGFRNLATKFLWAAKRLSSSEVDAEVDKIDTNIGDHVGDAFQLNAELIPAVALVEELYLENKSKTDMTSEEKLSEGRSCPHCGNVGHMRIIGTEEDVKEIEVGGATKFTVEAGTVYRLLACVNCERVTLESSHWNEQIDTPDEFNWRTLHPSKRPLTLGLPKAVEKELLEAEAVRTASPNAYALLTRRVLEAVCVDRGANGKTLHAGLQDLAKNGEIPAKLAEAAQSLRQLGNVGAHVSAGSLTVEDLPSLEALCRAVLEYVYAAPLLVTQAANLIEEVKKRG